MSRIRTARSSQKRSSRNFKKHTIFKPNSGNFITANFYYQIFKKSLKKCFFRMQDKASPPNWWRCTYKPARCAGFQRKLYEGKIIRLTVSLANFLPQAHIHRIISTDFMTVKLPSWNFLNITAFHYRDRPRWCLGALFLFCAQYFAA